MLAAASSLLGIAGSPRAAQESQEALLTQLRELLQGQAGKHFLTPLPGSRSSIVAIDTSSSLFFFLERGAIRGSAIDDFYAAYDAGDMDAAYAAFLSSAVIMLRVTDYGVNGLGNPMVTASGNEIKDVVFRDVGGAFARAPEVTAEDVEKYVELLRMLIAALQEGGG